MKHLKEFSHFSLNEEFWPGMRKFFSGYASKEEYEAAKQKFEEELKEIEDEVNSDPGSYYFNKEKIEQDAKSNKYRGYIDKRVGGRDTSKYYIIYVDGKTGMEEIATGYSRSK